MNIGIYIYDQAEVLDFSGPFEVFSTAARISEDEDIFTPLLISQQSDSVKARGGYQVQPHFGFHNHPALDVLIVVGGEHDREMDKPQVLDWIAEQADKVSLVASVCTGAFILAKAGVLTGERVTTHWADIPDLRQMFPALEVVEGARWIDSGEVVTSGGISAGIDMSLYLVEKLHSRELAEKTARQMEFDWRAA